MSLSDLLPDEWRAYTIGGIVVGAFAFFVAALVTWCAPDAPPSSPPPAMHNAP
jgi:hypothetical protein